MDSLAAVRQMMIGARSTPHQKRTLSLNPESDLIKRCLTGEETAWEELVRAHSPRIYAITYRFTGSSHQAQDLTQEVFLRVFRSLKNFRLGDGSFPVWLGRVTRNLLIDHYRKSKLDRASVSADDALPALEQATEAAGTDQALARRETGDLLQTALQKLAPELRETIILRDLEEMEYSAIAQVLQIPEGTVKSRLNRGRAELARLLRRFKAAL
jgi:RNA polymerase sigma-70 factor (ECF subfamily)